MYPEGQKTEALAWTGAPGAVPTGKGDGDRLRVCMVTGFRPTPGGGGMEKHVYELVRGLLRRGVDVEIICEDRAFLPDPDNELREHVRGVDPGSLHAGEWIERYEEKSRRFAGLLDPDRYDVVHCHSHYGRDVALKLAGLEHPPALVTTFHLTPEGQLERFRQLGIPEPEGAPIDRAVGEMEGISARLSDASIAVSGGVAGEIGRFYGVPEERIHVIYNWYDPGIFDSWDRNEARRRLDLREDGPYLLYIGHFQLHRGRLLAEAMRRLPEEVTLLVVHPEADAAIQEEFGPRVQFTGYLPPDRLSLHYTAADLQCFPTVYSGFGLVLVEGMACGCPPVVFDYSAMNEIVTPENGYVAPEATAEAYAASLLAALKDGSRKREAAMARARRFQMDPQIDKVLALYREAPARRPAGRGVA